MRIYRFTTTDGQTYAIPRFEIEADYSGAVASSDFHLSPHGGAYDPHGSSIAPTNPFEIPVLFEIMNSDPFEAQRELDFITGARGKVGELFIAPISDKNKDADLFQIEQTTHYVGRPLNNAEERNAFDDTQDFRRIHARCSSVSHTRTIRNYIYHTITMVFEIETLPWKGADNNIWHLDYYYHEDTRRWVTQFWGDSLLWDYITFNSAYLWHGERDREDDRPETHYPYKRYPGGRWEKDGDTTRLDADGNQIEKPGYKGNDWICVNNGNAIIHDAAITIAAGRKAIPGLEIEGPNSHLIFTGTIPENKPLVIDCGAMTVTNADRNAFGLFKLGPRHRSNYWFEIHPGENPIWIITNKPANFFGTLTITYSDGWA